MIAMRASLIAVFALTCALIGHPPAMAHAQTLRGDVARLQGSWWTRVEAPNRPSPPAKTKTRAKRAPRAPEAPRTSTSVLIFEGNTITFQVSVAGRTATSKGTVRLDEKATPKTIDFTGVEAAGEKLPDNLGIYTLKGNTLTICTGGPGEPRPIEFKGSPLGFPNLVTYQRGEPADRGQTAGRGRAVGRPSPPQILARPQELQGVTVVKADAQSVTLRTADGQEIEAVPKIERATDAQGYRVLRGDSLLKEGNVLDVMLKPVDATQSDRLMLTAVRLVQGESLASGKTPGDLYQGAIVGKVSPNFFVLMVEGKAYEVYSPRHETRAIDAQGKPMPPGQAARLLREGNKVDVVVSPKLEPGKRSYVGEIRLVEGQLSRPVK
jgi:uncharacterized protein (TIGR03067 family)